MVVLPWVPATATVFRRVLTAPKTSARLRRGRPRSTASRHSGLPSGTAVERVTKVTSPKLSAACPTRTSTPRAESRSSPEEAFRSDPLTEWPIVVSTSAMALIPAPPTPITCTLIGCERSGTQSPIPLILPPSSRVMGDDLNDPLGGIGL